MEEKEIRELLDEILANQVVIYERLHKLSNSNVTLGIGAAKTALEKESKAFRTKHKS
jgi:hypothetical protein